MLITDTGWARFKKDVAAMHAAKSEVIKDFPKAISLALKDGSPDIAIKKMLLIANRMLLGKAAGAAIFHNGKEVQLIQVAESFSQKTKQSFKFILSDLTTAIFVLKEPSGEIKARLEYLIFPDRKIIDRAKKIGIDLRAPEQISVDDIIEPIKYKTREGFIVSLADIDELLSGFRLGAYIDDGRTGAYGKINNDNFWEFQDRLEHFIERTHDINPYYTFRYDLGDGKSHLVVEIDNDIKNKMLSFSLNSSDKAIKEAFIRLQRDGILSKHVFQYDTLVENGIQ